MINYKVVIAVIQDFLSSIFFCLSACYTFRGGQPAAHWMVSGGALQLGKIFQMKNVPQLISSYIRGGQPVADCTLISSDDLFFFREQFGFSRKSKNLENFFQR